MTLRTQLAHLDYPRGSFPAEFKPEALPASLPELAQGLIWETGVDPIRCTPAQFEELREAFSALRIAESLRELLPGLRLAHLLLALADHHAAVAHALETGGEDALDSIHFALDAPEERALAERDRAERAARNKEKASSYYAGAERALGLEE